MMKRLPELIDQRGFSLAELLVAAGLSLFVLASIGAVFSTQTHAVKGQERKMEANEYALTVLDVIVREVRNTGYFPKGSACSNISNTAGIVSVSAQELRLVYDSNGDGSCENYVSFTYDSVNQNILRNDGAITDGNATDLQFNYYPQQTSGAAPAPYCVSSGVPSGCVGSLTSNLSSIQKITVSLTVQPKSSDHQFSGGPITMTATAVLRNHGL